MTRFLLIPMSLLLVVFAALSAAARAVGTWQPPNPVLTGFIADCEDKPQPCWYGIVPGVTTMHEARTVLSNQDYHFIDSTGWTGRAFMHYRSSNRIINCGEGLFDAVNNEFIYN
ncbi:MAG: hypothetical protein HXY41_08925, partial [Chloroflexi bacterium]|nr:hypothetical protein [Chloroflexota bacterium]